MQGQVLGQRYRIVRLIGAGGMGSVYEAVDSVTGARVAVKVITADMAKNRTLMGRFEREARAAANVDTPHIVKVLDAGVDAESQLPFLVMEYLEGEDVQQLIKRIGPLAPEVALRVVAQACLGLDRAHEARIIHRDIKPANFFLAKASGGQRVVKLLDFGIAKIAHDPSESNEETAGLTRTGSMLGSPLYMSPEQARGHKDLDRRADLWSMGVVLYQALTARTPHQDTDALGELIIAICTEEPASIQELAPWVPPAVAAVAHHAMRFAPDQRFQTAAEMLDAIRPLLTDGWAIEESMFRPLDEAERVRVEPLLVTQPNLPVGRAGRTQPGRVSSMVSTGGGTQVMGEGAGETSQLPAPGLALGQISAPGTMRSPAGVGGFGIASIPPDAAASSLQGFGSTVGERAHTAPGASTTDRALVVGAPPSTRGGGGARGVLLGLGVAVALALGGAVAYRVMRAPPEVTPQPAALTVALPTAEPKPRTVKVVVLPPDATVEVDGVSVTPNDGAIEIKGAIGSVHKVHVTSPDGDVLRDVALTEDGAIPPKVAVEAKPAKVPSPGLPAIPRGPLPTPPHGAATTAPLPLRNQR